MKYGITGMIERDRDRDIVQQALQNLRDGAIQYLIGKNLARFLEGETSIVEDEDLPVESDIILIFGGDGTLLYCAKKLGDFSVPLLGINTGHLGFLTEINPEELPLRIRELERGDYTVENRMMIEAVVDERESTRMLAINDFYLDKGGYQRTIKISLTIDGEYCHTYTSNGIIVATPTGSTAYSLSAGGPIVYPTVHDIVITPICPHTLSARPMLIPSSFTINLELCAGPDNVPLTTDGHTSVMLNPGQKITLSKSPSVLKLVHLSTHSFFRVLSSKLGWGIRNDNSTLKS